TYGGQIRNQSGAMIAGGNGGDSTASSSGYHARNGAAGVVFIDGAGGGSLKNEGTISGGNGGAATGATPGNGAAGVIVHDDHVTLINAGAINGGHSGHADPNDQTQANAVELDGNNNTLELRQGYSFTGHV